MRTSTLVLALIISSLLQPAMANECFPLKGKYHCTDSYGDAIPISIDFPSTDGVSLDEDRLRWGEWTDLQSNSELVNRRGVAACRDKALVTDFTADDINQRKEVTGKISWQTTWEKTDSGLRVTSAGELKPVNGEAIPFADQFLCTPAADPRLESECPDLKGRFSCPLVNGPQVFTFDMRQEGTATVYTVDGYRIPADGKSYPLPADGTYRNGTLRAFCTAGELNLELDGDLYKKNQFGGRMKILMKRSKNPDGSLNISNEGSLRVADQLLPFKGQGRCPRSP